MASVVEYIILGLVICIVLLISKLIEQHNSLIHGITNRSVLVTGCDTGFGNLLAQSLDARGVRVFAGCLTMDGAEALKKKTSSRLETLNIDVTDEESVTNALEYIETSLDGEGLWGLVNNAGVMPTLAPVEWTSMDEYKFTCEVNLFGTISVTKAFLPLVRKAKGRVVNVCSVTSDCGYPGISTYVISKAAVKMFSICLRRELLNTGVTVHTIEPGGFQTNVTSQERLQKIFRDAYKRADPKTKDVYSGHVARYIYTNTDMIQRHISNEPQQVPNAIMHALFAKYPSQSYLVGLDAQLFFRLVKFVPQQIVDYILGWPQPYGPKLSVLEE